MGVSLNGFMKYAPFLMDSLLILAEEHQNYPPRRRTDCIFAQIVIPFHWYEDLLLKERFEI